MPDDRPTVDYTGLMNDENLFLSWQQAEQRAVDHLQKLGFHDVRASGRGSDNGIDAFGQGVVAQVKHWSRPVGQPPVRDLYGTATAARSQAVFYASSGFTRQATEWAGQNGVALFTLGPDGPVALNTPAHELTLQRRPGPRIGIFAQQRATTALRLLPKVRTALDLASGAASMKAATGSARRRRNAEIAISELRRCRTRLSRLEAIDPSTKGMEKALRALLSDIRRIRP